MSILYIMHVCAPRQYTYEPAGVWDFPGNERRKRKRKKAFRLQIWEEVGGRMRKGGRKGGRRKTLALVLMDFLFEGGDLTVMRGVREQFHKYVFSLIRTRYVLCILTHICLKKRVLLLCVSYKKHSQKIFLDLNCGTILMAVMEKAFHMKSTFFLQAGSGISR